jgi:hypothetical protein
VRGWCASRGGYESTARDRWRSQIASASADTVMPGTIMVATGVSGAKAEATTATEVITLFENPYCFWMKH